MMLRQPNPPDRAIPAAMMACPDCKAVISKQANSCPHCGRAINANVGNIVLRVIFWLIVISGVGAILQRL